MKDLPAEGSGNKEVTPAKKRPGYGTVSFLQGIAGVCQADYLSRAHQGIPDGLVSDSTSGTAETVTKSSLGLVMQD